MSNINAFSLVVHEKNIFKGFCFLNLYKTVPLRRGHFCPQGFYLNKLESPGPKDVLCQILIHSGQWFVRRRLLNVFAKETFIKLSP